MPEAKVIVLSEGERYLTAEEVAARFGFPSAESVLLARRRGELPGINVSARRVRFRLSEMMAWAEGRKAS
jgi:hypothetical protein